MRSAAEFTDWMIPFKSFERIASSDDPTIAARYADALAGTPGPTDVASRVVSPAGRGVESGTGSLMRRAEGRLPSRILRVLRTQMSRNRHASPAVPPARNPDQ